VIHCQPGWSWWSLLELPEASYVERLIAQTQELDCLVTLDK
jgi:hypothetical protein